MTLAWMPPAITMRGMLAVTTSVIFHPLLKAMRYATADRHAQHHLGMTPLDHLMDGCPSEHPCFRAPLLVFNACERLHVRVAVLRGL